MLSKISCILGERKKKGFTLGKISECKFVFDVLLDSQVSQDLSVPKNPSSTPLAPRHWVPGARTATRSIISLVKGICGSERKISSFIL